MLRYLLAAILIAAPSSVQAHPGHQYSSDGSCVSIGDNTESPCSITMTIHNFVIVDGNNIWKYTEQFDMIFSRYYRVEMNGEAVGHDLCWDSSDGVHCRKFSFVYEN